MLKNLPRPLRPHPLLGVPAVLTLAVALLWTTRASGQATLSVGETAPNFTLNHLRSGEAVSLYEMEGRVVMLEFFAYW